MTDEDSLPTEITTHGDFSPGYVGGDYKVTLRGYRKPRTEPPFILPQQKTVDFVGRLDQLEKLEEILLEPKTHRMAGIVGLAGSGGIGKSALACYFAEKHRDKFPDGVIGIRLDSKKDIDTIAREFARLDGETLDEDDTRNASAIMQDLFASKRILLIIDNAETADIRELHPGGQECAIIVTTRDRSLPGQIEIPDNQLIDLPVFANPESLALLAQFIDQPKFNEEADAINRILVLVGNLPLAVEIVGKTLQNRLKHYPTFKIAEYTEALNLDQLKLRRDKHFNVRLCFQRSITYLEEDKRIDLIDAFAQLSVCANSGFALLTAMAAIGIRNESTAKDNLQELIELSLLNKAQTDSQRLIFHPLLQEFAVELAKERHLFELAKRNHANYFINRIHIGITEELETDLDDIINVAEWMADTKNESYVSFYLNLRTLFNRLGHWQRANKIIDVFLRLSEENENWFTLAQFRVQQAKFQLLQGEFTKAEKTLLDIETVIQRVEQPFDQKRTEAMRLNTLGGVYQRQGKFDEAVHAFQQSLEQLLDISDQPGQAKVLNSLGSVHQRQGKFDEAVHAFQQSAKIEEAIHNQRGQAMVLNSLGGVYQRQGKFDEAVHALQQSAKIEEAIHNQRGQAMVLNSLGGVYQRQGKFSEAVHAFQQSYELLIKLVDQRGQAMVLNSLGGVYQRQGKFDEAVHALQQSAKIEEAINNQRGQAMVLNSLGGVYQRQGKFDEAAHAFQQSYDISDKLGDERSLAMVLNSLGGVYQRQGKFSEAVHAFQQSYDISDKLGDERSLAMVLNSLGGVYQRQGKFNEAVHAFQKSYELLIKLVDQRGQAMVLNSLGGVYQRQGKFDEAVHAFQQSYDISDKLGDERSLAMVLNSLGGVYQRQGKFDEAVHALQQSAKIEEAINNQRGQAMVLNSLGGVYQRQGKFSEAVHAFQQSYELLIKLVDQRGQAMALNSLGGVYQRQGKFDEAAHAFQQSYDIGKRLKDKRHLAIVSTAWGQALMRQHRLKEAVLHLSEGFKIELELRNIRGLEIVTPPLCQALKTIGNENEAILICDQAIKIAPRSKSLLQLKNNIAR